MKPLITRSDIYPLSTRRREILTYSMAGIDGNNHEIRVFATGNQSANSLFVANAATYIGTWSDGSFYIGYHAKNRNSSLNPFEYAPSYNTSAFKLTGIPDRLKAGDYPISITIIDTYDNGKDAYDSEQEIIESCMLSKEYGKLVLNVSYRKNGGLYTPTLADRGYTPKEIVERRKAQIKAYKKAYRQSPEGKAAKKAWSNSPEGKAAKKVWNNSPERKAYKKA